MTRAYDATTSFLDAADGTSIAWYAHRPRGAVTERPVVLTNGLSTTDNFWSRLVPRLTAHRRVVHWDYRGHGRSGSSAGRDYAITTHADDLRRVTEAVAEDGSPPVHVAFSMGVTVLLELYRARPELVGAMVLVAGGADHPYASSALFRVPGARDAFRTVVGTTAPLLPKVRPIFRRLTASRAIFPIGRRLGIFGQGAPRDEVEHFLRTVGEMDLAAYGGTLASLVRASASDVLASIQVPVLVIAPERDVMALRGDLEVLRARIPGAEWLLVPGTGHAILLEAADRVGSCVEAFLSKA